MLRMMSPQDQEIAEALDVLLVDLPEVKRNMERYPDCSLSYRMCMACGNLEFMNSSKSDKPQYYIGEMSLCYNCRMTQTRHPEIFGWVMNALSFQEAKMSALIARDIAKRQTDNG